MATTEAPTYDFQPHEVQQAADQEELERLRAENQRLAQRVVMLRAVTNRLEAQIAEREEATEQNANDE